MKCLGVRVWLEMYSISSVIDQTQPWFRQQHENTRKRGSALYAHCTHLEEIHSEIANSKVSYLLAHCIHTKVIHSQSWGIEEMVAFSGMSLILIYLKTHHTDTIGSFGLIEINVRWIYQIYAVCFNFLRLFVCVVVFLQWICEPSARRRAQRLRSIFATIPLSSVWLNAIVWILLVNVFRELVDFTLIVIDDSLFFSQVNSSLPLPHR